MTPTWLGENLVLARRVSIGEGVFLQGCLLDWAELESWLVGLVADLLPEVSLKPATDPATRGESRRLAALPILLEPGPWKPQAISGRSPIRVTLIIAWCAAMVAVAAVGLLLWGVLRLSQRRATFVSAVTHELRTPLTTFQMYTEMLAEGMVPDSDTRQEYLQTLQCEAGRLTHLVENVLAYARLERGRGDGRIESLPLAEVLDPVIERLGGYASRAGMRLETDLQAPIGETVVRVNPSALEQVLVNLVDNACKYARDGDGRTIRLEARRFGDRLQLRLSDRGPGIPRAARRRLFQPFSKSAADAALSAPGVGLGLALSRRLARAMQGDLYLDESCAGGACFVLVLPLG